MSESELYNHETMIVRNHINRWRMKLKGYACRRSLSRCQLPDRFKDGRIIFLILITFLWSLVLILGFIGKWVSDSAKEFLDHYTNWVWSINTFFYPIYFFSLFQASRTIEKYLLYIFWWPLSFNNWAMFILVFLMLLSNPGTVTDNFKENGGDFSAGVVLVADRVFHVIPPLMWFIVFSFNSKDLREIYKIMYQDSILRWFFNPWDVRNNMVFFYILITMFVSVAPFFVYYNAFDFKIIYEVSTPTWCGILIVIGVLIISVLLPLFYLLPFFTFESTDNLNTWTINDKDPSKEDIQAYLKDHHPEYQISK